MPQVRSHSGQIICLVLTGVCMYTRKPWHIPQSSLMREIYDGQQQDVIKYFKELTVAKHLPQHAKNLAKP